MHNLLVAQSGGPTSAINATLSGVITEAMIQGGIDRIYGGLNGICLLYTSDAADEL